MQVKLVIDGKEFELEPNGYSKNYWKFQAPKEGNEDGYLIASVYIAKSS